MTKTNIKTYNYQAIRDLLVMWKKYKDAEYKDAVNGRRQAIDALVDCTNHYYRNKGFMITKALNITVDYTPHLMSKRYDYDVAYSLVFNVSFNGTPFEPVKDIAFNDAGILFICTESMEFVLRPQMKFLESNGVMEHTVGKIPKDILMERKEPKDAEVPQEPPKELPKKEPEPIPEPIVPDEPKRKVRRVG